jgi:hypothetical protein
MPARWHVSNALLMTCFNCSLHFSSNIQYRTECTYHVLKSVPSIKVLHILNPTKFDHSIIMPTSLESPEDTHNTTNPEDKPTLIPFPAASDDYHYLRNRTAILSAVFNAQPIDVSEEDSCRAWHDIVSPGKRSDDPDTLIAPLIKRPIHLDYGENVHIHPSCFINRDCHIAHSPECAVSIGENTIVGVGVRLLGVTHPIDWRERDGRSGVTLAADVKIGKECFVGAGVTLLQVTPAIPFEILVLDANTTAAQSRSDHR